MAAHSLSTLKDIDFNHILSSVTGLVQNTLIFRCRADSQENKKTDLRRSFMLCLFFFSSFQFPDQWNFIRNFHSYHGLEIIFKLNKLRSTNWTHHFAQFCVGLF